MLFSTLLRKFVLLLLIATRSFQAAYVVELRLHQYIKIKVCHKFSVEIMSIDIDNFKSKAELPCQRLLFYLIVVLSDNLYQPFVQNIHYQYVAKSSKYQDVLFNASTELCFLPKVWVCYVFCWVFWYLLNISPANCVRGIYYFRVDRLYLCPLQFGPFVGIKKARLIGNFLFILSL